MKKSAADRVLRYIETTMKQFNLDIGEGIRYYVREMHND